MKCYKIQFHSAVHVDSKGSGQPEVADDFIHSDTLSAALCISWSTLFPETGQKFFLSPPFRLSSAFPYIGNTLLFPAPVWRIWGEMNDMERKKFKKVRWISRELFFRATRGETIPIKEVLLLPNGVAVSQKEQETDNIPTEAPAWEVTERQRVGIDRLGLPTEGNLFFFALQFFAENAGFWFLADYDPDTEKSFRAALDFLGDSGIGADRNSGLGHFRVTEASGFPYPEKTGAEGFITVSLFNPSPDTDRKSLLQNAAYGLTTRSGWISGTTIGRPPIRAFTEGSFFSTEPTGRVVEMLDEETRKVLPFRIGHNAPRDFRTIAFPCKTPKELKEDAP
jgi:CRISPR-associated protein Csm4